MTEPKSPIELRRKTLAEATDFEREQLRFFLSQPVDVATALATLNPSLTWLRFFVEAKLAKDGGPVAAWIARNFSSIEAVHEVVENLHLLGPETAEVLRRHLDHHSEPLPPVMQKAWALLIESMRANSGANPLSGWYEIAPRIRSGDTSPELLRRLANTLRPTIRLSSPTLFQEDGQQPIEHAWQVLTVRFEVAEDVTAENVLSAWPGDASPEADVAVLSKLTDALRDALEQATDAEVEDLKGYSRSCADVPSIASHSQNAYHRGFLPITRVLADLWERLAGKSSSEALWVLQGWKTAPNRLFQRLVLFASANPVVSGDDAGQSLLQLQPGDLFLSGVTVEAVRLIKARWSDISVPVRDAILHRICEGPPRDWFRQGVPIDQLVDLARFELLADMERQGLALNTEAQCLLVEIRSRWPNWQPQPEGQAGFHSWIESPNPVVHDVTELNGVADENLVPVAARLLAEKGLLYGDSWRGLCLSDPDRAARGLRTAAAAGSWPREFWESLLWSQTPYSIPETAQSVAALLQSCSVEQLRSIVSAAAWWLSTHSEALADSVLWPLWDRIAESPLPEAVSVTGDALNRAMNSGSGRLAEILLRRLASGTRGEEISSESLARLDQLVNAPGEAGLLARVYLASNVHPLFERVPAWTRDKIIPLFDWTHPDAPHAWAARKYARHIGSPELFRLTKRPLLELFTRNDVDSDDIRIYSQWLISVLIANRRHSATYPLTEAEVRTALRRAGEKGMPSAAHRLMSEMGGAPPEQKAAVWQSVVGPIFEGVWPLDVDLQTSASTFGLVQLLRRTGEAFPVAANIVIPFIRSDDRPGHRNVIALTDAPEELFTSAPGRMLDLTAAVVGDAVDGSIYGLSQVLDRIRAIDPELAETPRFRKLANQSATM